MASLVDTNVLVYCYDGRFPDKQRVAHDLLRSGLVSGEVVLPHQALVDLVAAAARPQKSLAGASLLSPEDARREAESLAAPVSRDLPGRGMFRAALQGAAAYQLSWSDAHLWACAEVHGLEEIISEDFEHGRHYGSVRAVGPFLAAAGSVGELPPLYEEGAEVP